MKLPAEAAVPPGVVTEICPLVAAAGTVVEIWDAFRTVNVAEAPLNFRAVAPVKFVPVTVTAVAGAPLVGEKLAMVGAGCIIVKLAADVAVPFGVSTVIFPVVAAAGTAVVICVALFTVMVAAVPLNFTAVAPVKFVPVRVTEAPAKPLDGEKLVIEGAFDETVKLDTEVAVPLEVVRLILPVLAPTGTDVVIVVALLTVKAAVVPLNLSDVAPERFVPVTVTLSPANPLVGAKLVILGDFLAAVVETPPPPQATNDVRKTRKQSVWVPSEGRARKVSRGIMPSFFGASEDRARYAGRCTTGQ